MKRLTKSYRDWLLRRAENQYTRKTRKRPGRERQRIRQYHSKPVQIWQGGDPEYAICTSKPSVPPSPLCLSTNSAETTRFFEFVRKSFYRNGKPPEFVSRRKKNSTPKIGAYFDFSQIKDISTSAAVVLTAEYSRLATLSKQIPPTVELNSWDDMVVLRLYQLGFFNILGHIPDIEERIIQEGSTLTMRILCARNADELDVVDSSLQELGRFLMGANNEEDVELFDEAIVKTLTTISEAITNVTQHAYPHEHKYEFPHVESFWVAATADRVLGTLTVVVYDQGASIPVTYPRMNLTENIQRFLRRAVRGGSEIDYENDGTYVRAAMRYGGSRTDKPYRGKGFPQMFELLKSIGGGSLSIRSRGGWCIREPNGRVRSGYLPSSIGGTLVEWTVNLQRAGG